jgi:hypothetical protein
MLTRQSREFTISRATDTGTGGEARKYTWPKRKDSDFKRIKNLRREMDRRKAGENHSQRDKR